MSIYKKTWRTVECGSSPGCWCRVIVAKGGYYKWNGGDRSVVVGPGEIGAELAEHIVKAHNNYIKDKGVIK